MHGTIHGGVGQKYFPVRPVSGLSDPDSCSQPYQVGGDNMNTTVISNEVHPDILAIDSCVRILASKDTASDDAYLRTLSDPETGADYRAPHKTMFHGGCIHDALDMDATPHPEKFFLNRLWCCRWLSGSGFSFDRGMCREIGFLFISLCCGIKQEVAKERAFGSPEACYCCDICGFIDTGRGKAKVSD
jgi:hypothetical protein